MGVIYETKGRAREYFQLAANLYRNCEHGCLYCYVPTISRVSRDSFICPGTARVNILSQFEHDAKGLSKTGETRPVLLSFLTDPYQPVEEETGLTRQAIETLHYYNLNVAILTKAGPRAIKGISQLRPGRDRFGATLVFDVEADRQLWEPNAGTTPERLVNLKLAHGLGIRTFASFEPVIDPAQSLRMLERTVDIIDDFLVGMLNYDKSGLRRSIDWRAFAREVLSFLQGVTRDHPEKTGYIKRDLAAFLGRRQGFVIANGASQ